MHAFLKSDLIVEVMYNGKDITFLGPHVCYTVHILYNGNLCKFLKSLSMIEKQMKQSKKGRLLHMGYLQITLPILISINGLNIHEPLAYTVMIL